MSIKITDLSSRRTDTLYRDVSTTSKNRNTVGDGMNVLENHHAIRAAINNWLYTRQGQRPMLQRWGNKFFEFLFEPVTRTNAQLIGEELDRLPVDVPGVVMEEINIDVIADATGNTRGYDVNFTYSIPSLDLFQQAFRFDFLQNTGIRR